MILKVASTKSCLESGDYTPVIMCELLLWIKGN